MLQVKEIELWRIEKKLELHNNHDDVFNVEIHSLLTCNNHKNCSSIVMECAITPSTYSTTVYT